MRFRIDYSLSSVSSEQLHLWVLPPPRETFFAKLGAPAHFHLHTRIREHRLFFCTQEHRSLPPPRRKRNTAATTPCKEAHERVRCARSPPTALSPLLLFFEAKHRAEFNNGNLTRLLQPAERAPARMHHATCPSRSSSFTDECATRFLFAQ